MKSFDRDKPANGARAVFALVSRCCDQRPEVGDKFANVPTTRAYQKLAELLPNNAAEQMLKDQGGK
jgi:hypothetical protein